jgi:glucose/mannose transport system substrate-binding protein
MRAQRCLLFGSFFATALAVFIACGGSTGADNTGAGGAAGSGGRVNGTGGGIGGAVGPGTGGSGSGGESAALEDTLEIFSWWGNPTEKLALDALLDVFRERHPGVTVINAGSDAEARITLRQRVETGEPPDSFQAISGIDLLDWLGIDALADVNALENANGWRTVFPVATLDVVSQSGNLYGVPANIERENNLYYNIALLKNQAIDPPRTLAEFYAACSKLKAAGVTPLALPAAGWVLALVAFEALMPGLNGGAYYTDFFSGKANPSGPELRALFSELNKVLECSNVSDVRWNWQEQGDLLYRGDAAMYVLGDWLKEYWESGRNAAAQTQRPWQADIDFGVVPSFGSSGYYVFNSAVFNLPRLAKHPNAGRAFLSVLASSEGQLALNHAHGSVPARADVPLDQFDTMLRRSAEDYRAAGADVNRLLPGYASLVSFEFQRQINPALLAFAIGERARELDDSLIDMDLSSAKGSVDFIISRIAANYALLK